MKEKDCILVVDDDEGTRKSLTLLLKRKGFETEQAESGKEALAIAQRRLVNLTLLDIKLPDIEGILLLAPLKKTNPDMAIIMITGYASVESAVQALTAGASGYITKPIDLDGMLTRIKNALDHQHLVNEVKQAEDALRESEVKYRTLFDNMSEGFAYCWMIYDSDGRPEDLIYLKVNRAFDQIIGIKNVTGKRFTDVFSGIREAYPELFVIYGRVASTGTPESFEIDFKPIEKWLHISVYSPEKEYFVAVFEDITERKRAEEALLQSEHEFRSLAEAMPQIVWVTRADGWNIYFNQQWVDYTGLSLKESYGHGWNTPFHPDDRQRAWDAWQRATQHQDTYSLECRLRRADGVYQWWLIRGVPLRNASGEILKWFGTCTNIEDLKQAEDALALTVRKLVLMNDVAYQDIQNKVTALRGFSELSKNTKTETERLAFIAKEEKILADIHQLIKNTKQYQEMGLGKSQWVSVEHEIKMAAALTSRETPVSIDADLHELELYSDPLIERVFFQLIDNAIKHGSGLSRIIFSCHEVPDGLVLVCEDDGAGIDPSKRATLFSRITGDKARFGLFFVSEYLALAGMTIAETSEPGKGARFEITVPKGAYRFPMEGS
jgi:PAS domain S-box-containing protein